MVKNRTLRLLKLLKTEQTQRDVAERELRLVAAELENVRRHTPSAFLQTDHWEEQRLFSMHVPMSESFLRAHDGSVVDLILEDVRRMLVQAERNEWEKI